MMSISGIREKGGVICFVVCVATEEKQILYKRNIGGVVWLFSAERKKICPSFACPYLPSFHSTGNVTQKVNYCVGILFSVNYARDAWHL